MYEEQFFLRAILLDGFDHGHQMIGTGPHVEKKTYFVDAPVKEFKTWVVFGADWPNCEKII